MDRNAPHPAPADADRRDWHALVDDRLRAGLKMFQERYGKPSALVAAGGVAANEALRNALGRSALEAGTVLVVPPPALCTDNGAMIAWAGAERLALGLADTLATAPLARWPLADVKGPSPPAGNVSPGDGAGAAAAEAGGPEPQ